MKKAWNVMKEQKFDKRTEKLKKQGLHYMQENEKLERHIVKTLAEISGRPQGQQENLKTTEITTNSADGKSIAAKKKKSIKFEDQKTGHDKGEEFSHVIRPDEFREEHKEPNKSMGKKNVCDKEGGFPCNIKPGNSCKKRIKKSVCNGHKKLLTKYRLREGNEREWIERIKVIMEKQKEKPLELQLKELMPLVRDHRDIKNAFKAKRYEIR